MVSWRNFGRLGNTHFQAATCISYALKYGLEYSAPNWTSDNYWSPLYFKHLIHPKYNKREDGLINESCHEYQELPYKPEWENLNIVLNGYFQSWKYIDEYRNEIIKAFNYPYEMKEGICSIHARFGDYLNLPKKHILIDKDYLLEAMNYVYERTGSERFKVFSDDLNYFKSNFGQLHNFTYSTNNDIVEDLIEISCCQDNIGSSSTFSWWGAWLNQNQEKIVITQSKWFQDGWGDLETKDIIPSNWIKI
jgi:hypothetical protein